MIPSLFYLQNVIIPVIIIFIVMYGERASKGKLYNKICIYVAGMYSIAFMTGVRGMRENLGGGCRGCGLPPLK